MAATKGERPSYSLSPPRLSPGGGRGGGPCAGVGGGAVSDERPPLPPDGGPARAKLARPTLPNNPPHPALSPAKPGKRVGIRVPPQSSRGAKIKNVSRTETQRR